MPKWKIEHDTDDEEYPIVWIGDTYFVAEHDPNWIVDAHNADIDALTAERDELQRRLDAVVASVPDEPLDRPSNPNVTDLAIWRERNSIRRSIKAIAEGRDG